MASKRPFERFGSFILFKKLESDSISELWRAAEVVGDKVGEPVALRRFTGGDKIAFRAAVDHARSVVMALTGTTVAKGQKLGFVGDVPYLAHEYIGGRSLRMIVDRARGSNGSSANPLPVDQALGIAEKLASSSENLANVRYQGARLVHGALIPQFVWLSEEGEVRAAGQQFTKGLVGALTAKSVARELAAYFAPEVRGGAAPTKASDVWSIGAVLYLALTGNDFTTSTDAAEVKQAVDSAMLAARGEAVPADIIPILQQSLAVDPEKRYPSASEMRQALDKLLNGGEYSPTTFNLAFYMHNLLKKDMEDEADERVVEAAVIPADYPLPAPPAPAPIMPPFERPAAVEPAKPAQVATPFSTAIPDEPQRSKAPLIAVAAGLFVAVGAGAFMVLKPKPAAPIAPAANTASVLPQKPVAAAPIEPIVAAAPGADAAAAALDPDAKKKMIEDAVNKRLQEEMMKLQEEYNKQLQSSKSMQPSAPATRPSLPAAPAAQSQQQNDAAMSASQLDQQRRASQPASRPAQTETQAPSLPATPVQAASSEPAPAVPAAPQVREGDLVAINDLDSVPELRSPVRPTYPPMAAKQRKEATIIVSALIGENGRVDDVRVLRGDTTRSGFDEAAIRAVRAASFTPPMKDGKRVKTWKPLPIIFKLQ